MFHVVMVTAAMPQDVHDSKSVKACCRRIHSSDEIRSLFAESRWLHVIGAMLTVMHDLKGWCVHIKHALKCQH